MVKEWQRQNPDDDYYIQLATEPIDNNGPAEAYGDDEDEVNGCIPENTADPASSFFFCHQSRFQRHLLKR